MYFQYFLTHVIKLLNLFIIKTEIRKERNLEVDQEPHLHRLMPKDQRVTIIRSL